jgi:outer membrane protein assembly factor BamB
VLFASHAAAQNWPSFRGPNASGISDGKAAPVTWNVESGENVRWSVPIPGLSHSSPIVWGDRVYLASAVSAEADPELRVGLYGDIEPVNEETAHKWTVYALDAKSGAIAWERVAHAGVPKMKRHPKSTHANATPATDGTHIVAFFGSEGLYCYDTSGELLWQRDLGALDSGFYMVKSAQWGFASSPIIHDGTVIVQCDVQQDSFVAAFDVRTGEPKWRTPREDVPTWSTPTIYKAGDQTRVVVNGYKQIAGYDFESGSAVWHLTGGGDIPVPTPFIANELIIVHNAHGRSSPIYAIKTSASGDITLEDGATSNDAIAWSVNRGAGYLPTAIAYRDLLYNCQDNGRLTVYEIKTGTSLHTGRLGETRTAFSASAVATGGHVYFTSEDGTIFVVKAGPSFEVAAQNAMNDICMATPAISDGTIYMRTRKNLFALSQGGAK